MGKVQTTNTCIHSADWKERVVYENILIGSKTIFAGFKKRMLEIFL